MASLYKQRLQQLGVQVPAVTSTRLKDKLLKELPELEAHKKGRDVLLAFQDDVGVALSDSCDYSDAIILAKAAKILRRHMPGHKSTVDGTFNMDSSADAVPPSLLQFVGMVEHGADIKSQLRFGASKTDTAIAHLLQYNCYAIGSRKVPLPIDTQRNARRHSPSTSACRCLQRPGRGS